MRPLQEKEETVYVVPGSDAEEHVARRFPHKTIKRVGNGLRPERIQVFLTGLPLRLPAGQGGGAERHLPLHLHRQGATEATVVIREQKISVTEGMSASPICA